jgi:hypothetical protein
MSASNVVPLRAAAAPAPAEQPAQPAPTRSEAMTTPVAIEKFVAIRDKIAEIKKRHTEELSRYNLALATLEAWLIDDLNKAGVDSMRATHGTIFKTERTSCRVSDWSATLDFIRQNEAWDLLEARVSKTAAQAIVEDIKAPIPGVVIDSEYVLNVRRASK